MTDKDALMTITELARYLKIPKGSIYNMVYERKIPYIKIGKRLRFIKSEIDEWIRHKSIRAIE